MKLETLVYDFLKEVKLRHAYGTWRFYKNHLEHFLKFSQLNGSIYVSDVTKDLLIEYVSHMKKTCENVTINKNIGCVKRMFRHMNIEHAYLQSIEKFKEKKHTVAVLTEEQFLKIRRYIQDMDVASTNGVFYRAFLALLVDTGARISEIMSIEKHNVNLEQKEILLTSTKTKVDRVVYFTETLSYPAIKDMLLLNHKHKYLLHNIEKNRPAVYDDIRYILRKVKQKVGLKRLYPHLFRHTTATILIEAGADTSSVQKLLGHSNLSTTQIYIHVSNKHVRNSYFKNMKKIEND